LLLCSSVSITAHEPRRFRRAALYQFLGEEVVEFWDGAGERSTAFNYARAWVYLPDSIEEQEIRFFCVAGAEAKTVFTCMTTQQKITAIQAIVTNHQDNVAAMRAANVGQGLEALVIEAINTALKDDLAGIFSVNSSRLTAGKQPLRAAIQKVRRRRRT
jgi:hypothetical protein